MKLSSIEALRYGALENACLTGLGDGLTVVLGPNESGKTTFTALTRHVLFGYPDARTKERGFVPSAGARAARLVFEGESGEWAIERVDGAHRGSVSVAARTGTERPGLLGEIVGGVSEQTFRVVFGFGLDELAEIERGDKDDVVSRLHAAGAGLAVNPIDVRKELTRRTEALYVPRGQNRQVNGLAAQIRELRDRIRGLEEEALGYANDQARLRELSGQLEPLKVQRDELDVLVRTIERDVQRLEDASGQLNTLQAGTAEKLRTTVAELERNIQLIDVDQRVLAAAPTMRAVLDDASGFRQRLDAIAGAETAADQVGHSISAMSSLPPAGVGSIQDRAEVERWRDRLADLRRDAAAAAQRADETRTRANQTAEVAREHAGAQAARPAWYLAAGLGIGAVGLIAAVAGVLTGQWIAAALGAVVAVAGVAMMLWPRRASARGSVLPDEAARLEAEAMTQRALADSAAAALAGGQDEWRTWITVRDLAAQGDDPVAVRQLLDLVAERDRLASERDRHLAHAARERAAAEAWVVTLVDAAKMFDPAAAQIPSLASAPELATRVKLRLDQVTRASEERRELEAKLVVARTSQRETAETLEALRAVVTEIAARHDVSEADALPRLQALLANQREQFDAARQRCDGFADEVARLRGKLDVEGREDSMARARQELEGLRARAASVADEYVVHALAGRLLDRARERFERERQPEVVRTAAKVFSAMTGGRYSGVRVPLDGSGITVVAADGAVRTTAQLSRGTAEQLYLALRVGLIGSLGEQGRSLPVLIDDVIVNFDPERRAGAVQAIAQLATLRQVLFFTCHPETAESLVGGIPGAALVSLDRCELRA